RRLSDGGFEMPFTTVSVGTNPRAIASADVGRLGQLFTGLDGLSDLVTAYVGDMPNGADGGITVLFQRPTNPYFGPTENIPGICSPTAVAGGFHFGPPLTKPPYGPCPPTRKNHPGLP